MRANTPDGFYARVLAHAFPESHTFKAALYGSEQSMAEYSPVGECDDYGYTAGGATLSGYKLNDFGTHATISFNPTVDWMDVSVKTQCAVIYDADTGTVLNIMNFGRYVGVIGGLFTLTLHTDGVVQLGEKDDDAAT